MPAGFLIIISIIISKPKPCEFHESQQRGKTLRVKFLSNISKTFLIIFLAISVNFEQLIFFQFVDQFFPLITQQNKVYSPKA